MFIALKPLNLGDRWMKGQRQPMRKCVICGNYHESNKLRYSRKNPKGWVCKDIEHCQHGC